MNSLLSFLLLVILTTFANAGQLKLIILDVGEGQSVLLKRNNRGILIDTGHVGMAATLLNKLDQYDVEHIDRIILTHLDPDHASGYFRLREAFPDATVLSNGDPASSRSPIDTVRWIADALAADPAHEVLRAGDSLSWMGVKITTLWPNKPGGDKLNNNSLVLAIHFGTDCGLIMGDTGHSIEKKLLKDERLPANLQLLVAGHHGSANTSHAEFLSRLKPEQCVVSVNKENIRGYPALSTLDRLMRHCDTLFRTDRDGDIHLIWHMDIVSLLPESKP
jgi:competence protein ComEC